MSTAPARQPRLSGDLRGNLRIAGYESRWRADFARLNLEWLQRWFVVEDFDRRVLEDPETHLLSSGGRILFALRREGDVERVVGTVALRHDGNGVYEMTKMAVDPAERGRGIGRALLLAILRLYRGLDGNGLYLESSSKLEPALRLYRSLGFEHRPPRPDTHYARADVHMVWRPRD